VAGRGCAVGLPERFSSLWCVNELELEPIGIGEEQDVVAVAILRIVSGRIENRRADLDKPNVELIDIF
jgi:hypothetical protein